MSRIGPPRDLRVLGHHPDRCGDAGRASATRCRPAFRAASGPALSPPLAVDGLPVCTLGILPHMAAAAAGLATVLQADAEAFQVLKVLGVGYLFVLAWITLRDRDSLSIETDADPRSSRMVMALTGFMSPRRSRPRTWRRSPWSTISPFPRSSGQQSPSTSRHVARTRSFGTA